MDGYVEQLRKTLRSKFWENFSTQIDELDDYAPGFLQPAPQSRRYVKTSQPCKGCEHVAHCAATGDACIAFVEYVENYYDWADLPREPRSDIAAMLFSPDEKMTAKKIRAIY